MRSFFVVCSVVPLLFVAACSEKPQNLRKTDAKAWDAAQNGYVVAGWKSGDQASWDEQMRNRAQSQNEYTRISGAAP